MRTLFGGYFGIRLSFYPSRTLMTRWSRRSVECLQIFSMASVILLSGISSILLPWDEWIFVDAESLEQSGLKI